MSALSEAFGFNFSSSHFLLGQRDLTPARTRGLNEEIPLGWRRPLCTRTLLVRSAQQGRNQGLPGLSEGGELVCRPKGDRVELEGACAFYMEGMAEI